MEFPGDRGGEGGGVAAGEAVDSPVSGSLEAGGCWSLCLGLLLLRGVVTGGSLGFPRQRLKPP